MLLFVEPNLSSMTLGLDGFIKLKSGTWCLLSKKKCMCFLLIAGLAQLCFACFSNRDVALTGQVLGQASTHEQCFKDAARGTIN